MIVVRFSLDENRQLKRVKKIVEFHGDDIRLGECSDGAQFILCLPLGNSKSYKTGGQYLALDLLQKGMGFEQCCIVFRTPVKLWLD